MERLRKCVISLPRWWKCDGTSSYPEVCRSWTVSLFLVRTTSANGFWCSEYFKEEYWFTYHHGDLYTKCQMYTACTCPTNVCKCLDSVTHHGDQVFLVKSF